MRLRTFRLLAVAAVLMLVVAACAGDDAGSETTTTVAVNTPTTAAQTTNPGADTDPLAGLPVIDPLEAPSGDIAIAGSSTVFPLSTEIMSLWEDEGGPGYSIDSIGSGGGFERFCVEGASDIANASRPIKDEEIASCESIGRTPIEIRVGTDALSLVISKGNTFATELTLEELASAFSLANSGATWADVNPAFPAHPIALFSPGADSGTFDYFNEEVFPDDEVSPILSSIAQIVGEDDNVTVKGVAEDGCTEGDTSTTCAIGYFGYAYYKQNADVLQAVAIEGVAPGDDSVNEGTYPLARPLFMYTDAGIIAEKPQVAYFVAYYLNNVDSVIGKVGYFPAPDEALQEAAAHVATAAGW
ncbi:MAG: substrate-binding domain-containing protein [Acidimicrobiia bacterium]|nr:substrate-binding domain-containing protein [Acidimicrobiia bacterium]